MLLIIDGAVMDPEFHKETLKIGVPSYYFGQYFLKNIINQTKRHTCISSAPLRCMAT